MKLLLAVCIILIIAIIVYFLGKLYFERLKDKRDLTSISDMKKSLLTNNNHKSFDTYTEIPKILIQTYKNKDIVPEKVFKNIAKFAPEYTHLFFDDKACISFIKKYYSKEVLDAYNRFSKTAHKADLFRYCVLYIYGGIYMDIKTELIQPLSSIVKSNILVQSVLSKVKNTIYQGIIITKPYNDMFLKLIYFAIHLPKYFPYQTLTTDFYDVLRSENGQFKLYPGLNSSGIYLFQEKILNKAECEDGKDRYGFCSYIFNDDKPIIKTRYSDFPWK